MDGYCCDAMSGLPVHQTPLTGTDSLAIERKSVKIGELNRSHANLSVSTTADARPVSVNSSREKLAVDLARFFKPYAPPCTDIASILKYWAENQGDVVAFAFTDGETIERSLTFTELDRSARAVAAQLQSSGAVGNRVLLLYPPGLDFVIGFFGCLYAGAIAVPAFPPRRNRKGDRIQSISEDCEASWAFTNSTVYQQILSDASSRQDLAKAKLVATDQIDLALAETYRPHSADQTQPAVLQYTSGSTGQPKGVVLTHRNLVANSEFIMQSFKPDRNGSGMSWLPTYHDMGLIGGVVMPVYLGSTSTLMSPMSFLQRPVRWLRAITASGATLSGGPNFAYQLCVDKITDEELNGLDLSKWDVAFNGAEPVRATTLRAFADRFAEVGFRESSLFPCYGMAETTLIVTGGPKGRTAVGSFNSRKLDENIVEPLPPGDSQARDLIGCGEVLLNEEIIIVQPETFEPLSNDRIGEIWIRSESVGNGYWNKPEVNALTFGAMTTDGRGPFLRTGDLGFFHDGQIFIAGRLKDLIIVRGVNRYPQDIEQTVEAAHPCIQSGAVAAFADNSSDRERMVITAEVQRVGQEDWNEVIKSIKRRVTEIHELPPDGIILVRFGSLPKTSSGKIQRHACLRAFRDNDLRLVAQWKNWEVDLPKQAPMIAASTLDSPKRNGQGSHNGRNGSASTRQLASQPDQEIVEVVIEAVRAVAQERAAKLDLETNLVLDLGLDSLERLQIAHSLEQSFGGRFPEDLLQEIETIREVSAAIEKNFGKAHLQSRPAAIAEAVPNQARREVLAEDYQFAKLPEYRRLKQTMAQFQMTGLPNPYFTVHQSVTRDTTWIDGRELISFASYNYLGMSGDPDVIKYTVEAVQKYGTSVSASRLVSGEKDIHRQLEQSIADWVGVEDSIVLVGGHSTNETVIGHMVGPGDLILHDALSHNSIVQGAILSGARRRPFPHNDWETLDRILAEVRGNYRRVLVIVEGVYSMDGDYPELPKFVEVKNRHKAWLMVDEAHSIGTMGDTGRGIGEHFHIDPKTVDVWMGTLSKSFGSCGGYIAGCKELVEYLKYTAPGFVFSVGLSPANTAAAIASLEVLKRNPDRVATLQSRSSLFLSEAKARGLNTGQSRDTAVVPVITGNSLHALQLSRKMFEAGVNVQPILYPAVEESAARLRFFITSTHSEEQILYTVEHVEKALQEINPSHFRKMTTV